MGNSSTEGPVSQDRAHFVLSLKFPAWMPVFSLRPTDGPHQYRWPATAGVAGRDDIVGEGRSPMPSKLWSVALRRSGVP